MIGRTRELATLLAHVDATCAALPSAVPARAQDHTRNVVFVTGEAGVGKTTLLETFRAALAQRTGPNAPLVAATECSTPLLGQDVGQVEALEPWAELLEKIVEHDGDPKRTKEMAKLMGSLALAWIHVVPVVGGILESSIKTTALVKDYTSAQIEKSHAASQEQMFQQYVNFLSKASEAHPLVLILDDFHWADTSSTNLLFSAARHLVHKRVLFIVSYRADDAASSREGKGHPLLHVRNELGRYSLFTDVVVPRMTSRDIDEILRDRYTRYTGNADFEAWLAQRSGGNALFISQYLSTLEEDGILSSTGQLLARFDKVRVPTTAFSVIEERIHRLDDESKELLRYASVEGTTFTASVLSALTEIPKLKLLQKLRLIAEKHAVIKSLGKERIYARETTAFQFTNVLMQRALYEGLEEEERDELHSRIFRSIKDEITASNEKDPGSSVRLTAHAASPEERLFAARLLLDAAYVSWTRFAEEETLGLLRALAIQIDALEGKVDDQFVRELQAESRVTRGLIEKFHGHYAQALEHLRAGRAILESIRGKEARVLQVMVREAFTLENWRQYAQAEAFSREVLARAETQKDERARGAMLNNLGLVLTASGRLEEGLEAQQKSLAVRERTDDVLGQAVSLGSMGLALFSLGRTNEALDFHRRSLALRETNGDRVGQGYSLWNIGNVLAAIGRTEEALEHYAKSARVREAIGDVVGQVASLESEAKLLVDLGRKADAAQRLLRALDLRESSDDPAAAVSELVRLGMLFRELGDARAREFLDRAHGLARDAGADALAAEVEAEVSKLPVPANGAPVEIDETPENEPPREPPRKRTVLDWIDRKLELRPARR